MNFDYNSLKNCIMLIAKGIQIPDKNGVKYEILQKSVGGSGPRGYRFKYYKNSCSAPLTELSIPGYTSNFYLGKFALKGQWDENNSDNFILDDGGILSEMPKEKFIDEKLSNDLSISKVVGRSPVHPFNTLSLRLGNHCFHIDSGQACKYCTLDMISTNYPVKYPEKDWVEALEIVFGSGNYRSLTLTTATINTSEETVKHAISLAREIKKIKNISLHLQVTPLSDLSLIGELSDVYDNIGILIDIYDEEIRKHICPGKSNYSKELYVKNWTKCVEHFGWGNVMTTGVLGFGEDFDSTLNQIASIARLGVIPGIMFLRIGSSKLEKNYIPSYYKKSDKEIVDFCIEVGKILMHHNLAPEPLKAAGCIGCSGCGPLLNTLRYIKNQSENR